MRIEDDPRGAVGLWARVKDWMRLGIVFCLFVVSCCLLYFGSTMLLFVPGVPGGPYWVEERLLYGLIPATLGVGLLVAPH